ncbi:hypothetical protein GCM10010271_64750 [Streptomyces kurssanovii]|nr:hypothetical protein GCM10010271_64750 [Streptomyces kurssanovii]
MLKQGNRTPGPTFRTIKQIGSLPTGFFLTRSPGSGADLVVGRAAERLAGRENPACDLMIAFTLMSANSRAAFRDALCVDDATWMRGRGWALATGLNAYTSYAAVNPRVAAQTTREITQGLTDQPITGMM